MARGEPHRTPTKTRANAGPRAPLGRYSGSPSLSSTRSSRARHHSSSRAPISPPPLRRSTSSSLPRQGPPSMPVTWTVEQLVDRLKSYRHKMREDHNQLAKHTIESIRATDRRVHSGDDLFAKLSSNSVSPESGHPWKIRFKVCPWAQ
jgi:hypothetical protein